MSSEVLNTFGDSQRFVALWYSRSPSAFTWACCFSPALASGAWSS